MLLFAIGGCCLDLKHCVQDFFEYVDQDSSGTIDFMELYSVAHRVCPTAPVAALESLLTSLFDEAGEDGDGTLSMIELAKWSVDGEFYVQCTRTGLNRRVSGGFDQPSSRMFVSRREVVQRIQTRVFRHGTISHRSTGK